MQRVSAAVAAAFCVSLAAPAIAQQGLRPGDERPELPALEAPDTSGRILPPLRIPATPSTDALSGGRRVHVRQYRIVGATVLSGEELADLTQPYLDREVSWAELEDLRDRITLAYVERGYVSSGAVIPDQQVQDGVVVIQVVEGTLARVDVQTDGRYRTERLQRRLERDAAGPVNVTRLEAGLQRLQKDERIASVAARLVPSEQRGRSDLEVRLHEAPPYRLGLELSNYEVPAIGAYRTRLDGAWLNVLGYGDTAAGTYSVSEGLQEIEASYELPVNDLGTSFGVFTDQSWSEVVEAPKEFDALDIESRAWTGGLSLRHPLLDDTNRRFELFGSAELRYSKSSLLGSGFSFSEGPEDGVSKVSVLRFGQEWSQSTKHQAFVARSVVSWGNGAFDATTHSQTGLPDSRFLAWLAQLQYAQRFTWLDSLLVARLDGQLSNDSLLGLEQFSMGGPTSVRGYRQNTLVGDQGVIGSLELRVPVLRRGEGRPWLELAPFVDAGYATSRGRQVCTVSPLPDICTTPPGTSSNRGPDTLVGAGIAARVALTERMDLELTWAESLKNIPPPEDHDLQDSGLYFRLTARFP